ncbi:MAG: hypothetical protein R3C56_23420 [Pirellulaceae bacterium]
MESSQQPADDEPSAPGKKKKYNGSKLSLPQTTLAGPGAQGRRRAT